MPTLMRSFLLHLSGLGSDSEAVKRCEDKRAQILRFVDDRLSRVPWLAGDEFTAADIMTVVCFTGLRCHFPYSLSGYTSILDYLKRVVGRDGYRRALWKADPGIEIETLIGPTPPPPRN